MGYQPTTDLLLFRCTFPKRPGLRPLARCCTSSRAPRAPTLSASGQFIVHDELVQEDGRARSATTTASTNPSASPTTRPRVKMRTAPHSPSTRSAFSGTWPWPKARRRGDRPMGRDARRHRAGAKAASEAAAEVQRIVHESPEDSTWVVVPDHPEFLLGPLGKRGALELYVVARQGVPNGFECLPLWCNLSPLGPRRVRGLEPVGQSEPLARLRGAQLAARLAARKDWSHEAPT